MKVTDPVCRMTIEDKDAAGSSFYKGADYYFCSIGCKERFIKAPETFTSAKRKGKAYCTYCQTEILDELYIKKNGSYCCAKCYFRDKYLGDIIDRMEGIYLATIEAFVEAIDAREHEVGNHSCRVTQFAMVLAKKIGIAGRGLVDIYCGSLLHDIGKIGIPDVILQKQGELSEEEHEMMSRHPEIGYKIISHIGYLSKAAEIIYSHHEHYDGSGYPRGLKGMEIPLGARIFSVCDTLDALTVDRAYRKALSYEEAKGYICSMSGILFDPEVIKSFLEADGDLKEFIAKIMF